jgi:hypothetical protein
MPASRRGADSVEDHADNSGSRWRTGNRWSVSGCFPVVDLKVAITRVPVRISRGCTVTWAESRSGASPRPRVRGGSPRGCAFIRGDAAGDPRSRHGTRDAPRSRLRARRRIPGVGGRKVSSQGISSETTRYCAGQMSIARTATTLTDGDAQRGRSRTDRASNTTPQLIHTVSLRQSGIDAVRPLRLYGHRRSPPGGSAGSATTFPDRLRWDVFEAGGLHAPLPALDGDRRDALDTSGTSSPAQRSGQRLWRTGAHRESPPLRGWCAGGLRACELRTHPEEASVAGIPFLSACGAISLAVELATEAGDDRHRLPSVDHRWWSTQQRLT